MEPIAMPGRDTADAAHRLLVLREQLALLAGDLVDRVAELEPVMQRIAAGLRSGSPVNDGVGVGDLRSVIGRYQQWNGATRRFDLNRSRRQYAALLGVSPAALTRYLAGERPLPLALVQAFLGHFPDAVDAVASALLAGASGDRADSGVA